MESLKKIHRAIAKVTWVFALIAIVFVAAVLLFGTTWLDQLDAPTRWFVIIGLMLLFLVSIGIGISEGRLDGVLIDWRYKICLSRLQIVAWTVLILSAYMTIALPRSLPEGLDAYVGLEDYRQMQEEDPDRVGICFLDEEPTFEVLGKQCKREEFDLPAYVSQADFDQKLAKYPDLAKECSLGEEQMFEVARDCRDPLGITFPTELVAALGISAASFAGSTLVKSSKKDKKIKTAELDVRRLETLVEEAEATVEKATEELTAAQQRLTELQSDASITANDLALDERQKALDEADAEVEAARGNLDALAPEAPENTRATAETELQQAKEKKREQKEALDLAQRSVNADREKIEQAQTAFNQAKQALETAQSEKTKLLAKFKKAKQDRDLQHSNKSIDQASWADLFRGEEEGNWKLVDISKVQMFFFTIVVIFAYSTLVYGLFKDGNLRNPLGIDFPSFSASLNALLGISHAGYLTVKTTERTKELPLPEEEEEIEDS